MHQDRSTQHLQILKKEQSEKTRIELEKALERFETGKLKILPKGSKLTRLNFSTEAGVTRDTPFAKYRYASDKSGEYRYPEIVAKFYLLKSSQEKVLSKNKNSKQKLLDYQRLIKELQDLLAMSRNVVNAQDILIEKLKKDKESLDNDISIIKKQNQSQILALEEKISLLSEEVTSLRRSNLRLIDSN